MPDRIRTKLPTQLIQSDPSKLFSQEVELHEPFSCMVAWPHTIQICTMFLRAQTRTFGRNLCERLNDTPKIYPHQPLNNLI